MHKAGGIIALIAGIVAILAMAANFFVMIGTAVFAEGENAAYDTGYTLGTQITGGIIMVAIVIVLSIIILNTRTRWPGIVLAIATFLAIISNWAGGIVSVCLAFALLGALMSLNLGRPKQENALSL